MINEISYLFQPSYIEGKFEKLSEDDFKEICPAHAELAEFRTVL
jgi:hypothetical protein